MACLVLVRTLAISHSYRINHSFYKTFQIVSVQSKYNVLFRRWFEVLLNEMRYKPDNSDNECTKHISNMLLWVLQLIFLEQQQKLNSNILLQTQILKLISVAFHTVPCTEHVWDIWKNKPLCISRFYIMAYHKTVNKRGNSRDGCGLHPGGMSAGVTLQSALRLASNHLSSTLKYRI